MKVFCIHIPRYQFTEAGAIYDTQWSLTPARKCMMMLDELHENVRNRISFEFYCVQNMVYLCFATEDADADLVVSAIYAAHSTYEIKEIDDYTQSIDQDTLIVTGEIRLKARDVLPCKNQGELTFNAMSPLIPVLAKTPGSDRIMTQLVLRAAPETAWHHFSLWRGRMAERASRAMNPRFWMKRGLALKSYEKMGEKCNSKLFWFNYRVSAMTQLPPNADANTRKREQQRLQRVVKEFGNTVAYLNNINENGYYITNFQTGHKPFEKMQRRSMFRPRRLMTYEASTLWLIPGLPVMPMTAQVVSEKGPPPKNLPIDPNDPQISFFGHTNFREQNVPFGVRRYDRRRHFYIVGKSGSGKSCLMQLLIKNDIEHGYGCCVLDPHGDLVDDLLKMVPKHRVKDVVLFDPSDTQYPPSFNPLSAVRPELKMRATIGFIEVFKRVMGVDWSEKMDHIVRYSMLALLAIPGSSILSLRKLLTDDEYREAVLDKVEDEQVRRFWQDEYMSRIQSFEGDVSRLLTRLDHLLATDMVRNIIGQPMNLFNFREFMDTRKIVLIKVSKGILGADNAQLLGALVIAKVYEAAMSRADMPMESRQDFYFYIDEFQNFANESFGEILSESRKYRLSLTFANQYLGQLPDETRQTVFGNVGNILSFRVGGNDATILAGEFKPRFAAEDIMNLAGRDFYIKMSIDGEVQETFSGHTLELPVPLESQHFAKECIRHSRSKYSLPLEQAIEALNVSEYGVYERESAAAAAATEEPQETPQPQG